MRVQRILENGDACARKMKRIKEPPFPLAYGKLFCVITLMISTCSSEINIEIPVMTFDYAKDNEALAHPLSASIVMLNTVFAIAHWYR